jgi:hypothetical protein
MTRRNLLFVSLGLAAGLALATHWPLLAQGERKIAVEGAVTPRALEEAPAKPTASVQDALLKPYHFRFGRPTSLADVKERLARDLGAAVVLDLAALDRLDIEPEDTVTLELDGVRLKTGLRLLLDQVGLTYRVVAEDNLLVLTDKEGSDDPVERVMAELHELHRDVHDVQDAIDELRELSGLIGPEGARVRKPTIIEEMPENPVPKPGETPAVRPGPKPESGPKPHGNSASRPRTRL